MSLLYLNVDESQIIPISDFLIRQFINLEIIDVDDLNKMNLTFQDLKFRPIKFHVSLFRVEQSNYNFKHIIEKYSNLNFET